MFKNLDKKYKNIFELIGYKTIVASVIFFIGLVYINSYLNYFGIKHLIWDIPVFFIMIQGIIPIIIIILFLILFLYLIKYLPKSKNSLILNILFSILTYYFVINYIISQHVPSYQVKYWNFIIGSVLFFFFIWDYWHIPINNLLNKLNINMDIIYTILFIITIILFFYTAEFKGISDARKIIEEPNSRFIEFKWKEKPPEDIYLKDLILLTYQNGNYYVANHKNPAPESPDIFIISSDKISYARISYNGTT